MALTAFSLRVGGKNGHVIVAAQEKVDLLGFDPEAPECAPGRYVSPSLLE
jgi:hypothetical protein